MNQTSIKPQNLPEALIWYYIIYTYPIYFVGGQYVCATFLATFLMYYMLKKWWSQTDETPLSERITISWSAWVWIVAVLLVEVALIIAHIEFELGISQIIKSSLSWYRGWGLIAIFILIGHLNIRPQIIYRAICILCLHSLIAVIICSLAQVLKIPIFSYVSPLKAFGGVSDSYRVYLFYVLDEYQPRMQLFAPWPPALGLVGNIYFFLAQQELNKRWRWIGMIGAVAMIFGSVSRSSIICLPMVLLLTWLLTNILRPQVYFLLALCSTFLGIFATTIIRYLQDFKDEFNQARSGSSEVRAILAEMAKEAWWNEAPIWGHGRFEEKGPAVVAYKPLGSHHFWYGVLYSYGAVGFIASAVAFLWSFIDLLIKAQTNEYAKVGLSIIIILFFFTFAENLDGLVFMYWSGLVMLGIAFKQKSSISMAINKQNQRKTSTLGGA